MKHNSMNTLMKLGEAFKQQQVQQRVSFAVMFILLTVTAWIAGQMIWQPWSIPSVSKWQPSNVARQETTSSPQIDLSNLQNSHLFGQYQSNAPVVQQPKVQDAPKSRLNLVLVGVVTSSVPEKSLAVIANKGTQATYGLNEMIEGTRAKLIQVQQDRVIIDNSGRNETVMLEGLKFTKPAPQVIESSSKQIVSNASQDTLDQIREEIRNDAQMLFEYVRMSQVKRDEEVVGYRLSPGKDKALFESVGLKAGDIATAINGLDLKDSASMGEVWQNLSQMNEVTLTVERDGQLFEIYIEL
ncbi:type II secretion system protein GspC [Vibrio sinaloensis]|uniref:type II secretion system protein GspC n=1 Tax=Vibrio TaxID=662 RepID=UPI0022AFDD56|nr:type II secretion system protein GspC [Vibrio sinaloensis]MCZ4294725.1 type II secretion system protein GspC [Vibrio sinaloensis]